MIVFLGAALMAHLSVWPEADEGAIQSAGVGGDAVLNILAANATIAHMVDLWDSPPQVSPVEVALASPQFVASDPSPRVTSSQTDAPLLRTPQVAPVPPLPNVPDAPSLPVQSPSPPKQTVPQPPSLTAAPKPAPPAPETPKAAPQKKQPAPASAAQNAKRAAGSGQKQAAGEQGKAQDATLSDKKRVHLMSKWGARIRAKIARKIPKGRGKGTAMVMITVAPSGALISAKIAGSSGDPELDKLALGAVHRAANFPAAPKGVATGAQSFRLPLVFK